MPIFFRSRMVYLQSSSMLPDHPIFGVEKFHEIDARHLERAAHARNFPQAVGAGFFGDDRQTMHFGCRDQEGIGGELFLPLHDEARIGVDDVVDAGLDLGIRLSDSI